MELVLFLLDLTKTQKLVLLFLLVSTPTQREDKLLAGIAACKNAHVHAIFSLESSGGSARKENNYRSS